MSVSEKHAKRSWVTMAVTVNNQDGKLVARGESKVIAPTESETVTIVPPPSVELVDHDSPKVSGDMN